MKLLFLFVVAFFVITANAKNNYYSSNPASHPNIDYSRIKKDTSEADWAAKTAKFNELLRKIKDLPKADAGFGWREDDYMVYMVLNPEPLEFKPPGAKQSLYDRIIAPDFDWTTLTEDEIKLIAKCILYFGKGRQDRYKDYLHGATLAYHGIMEKEYLTALTIQMAALSKKVENYPKKCPVMMVAIARTKEKLSAEIIESAMIEGWSGLTHNVILSVTLFRNPLDNNERLFLRNFIFARFIRNMHKWVRCFDVSEREIFRNMPMVGADGKIPKVFIFNNMISNHEYSFPITKEGQPYIRNVTARVWVPTESLDFKLKKKDIDKVVSMFTAILNDVSPLLDNGSEREKSITSNIENALKDRPEMLLSELLVQILVKEMTLEYHRIPNNQWIEQQMYKHLTGTILSRLYYQLDSVLYIKNEATKVEMDKKKKQSKVEPKDVPVTFATTIVDKDCGEIPEEEEDDEEKYDEEEY